MDFKVIEKFIETTKKDLFTFSEHEYEQFFEGYVLDNERLPLLFHNSFDFEKLQKTHFKTIQFIEYLRDIALMDESSDEDESINLMRRLFSLKKVIDSIFIKHKEYSPKIFRDNYNELWSESNMEEIYLSFHTKNRRRQIQLLKKLYKKVLQEKRIDKQQRRAFISLFINNQAIHDVILWNGKDYDLRAFLTALVHENIITFDLSGLNKFAFQKFHVKKRNGKFEPIKINTFKAYQNKSVFKNSLENWSAVIRQL